MSVKHVKQCGNCPLHQYVAERKTTVCSETGKCIVTHHARNHTCPFDFFDHPVSETSVETILSLMASGKKWLNWHTWPNVQAAYRKLCADAIAAILPCPNAGEGRGIVIVGGGRYFISALTNIRLIRHLGCTLPILLVGLDGELPDWQRQLVAPHGVTCATWSELAPDHPRGKDHGWELKTVAAMFSPFAQTLHLDADSFPQRDPTFLFDDPRFNETGAVFWQDWPPHPSKAGEPLTAEVWEAVGLAPRDEPAFETGQFLVDKKKWWHALWLSNWLCQKGWEYYFNLKIWYGDKECPHVAARLLGMDYAMPPHLPRTGGAPMLLQRDFDDRPLFGHRTQPKLWLETKNPKAYPDIPQDALTMELFEGARLDYFAAAPKRYIVGVTVCVNHADYLEATIGNRALLDDWIIVTVADDPAIALCQKHGIRYTLGDRLNANGSSFNLGALRNDGISAAIALYGSRSDLWILFLDGDCRFPAGFREAAIGMSPDTIYGAKRSGLGEERHDQEISGFFQLFHGSTPNRYREDHKDAGNTDVWFRDLWPMNKRQVLPLTLEHLGTTGVDWKGRVSPAYDPNAKPIPLTPARIARGAVGIAKAKLHIDRASDEVIAQRKATCEACSHLQSGRCDICRCSYSAKVTLRGEACPIGRWPAVPSS